MTHQPIGSNPTPRGIACAGSAQRAFRTLTAQFASWFGQHVRELIIPAFLACAGGSLALRAGSPFQLSLLPPETQIVHADKSVTGLRLSVFYGQNANMTGFDLGFAHETTLDFRGFGIGLVNSTGGNAYGVQWSPVGYARIGGEARGWQCAFVSHVGNMKGLQGGLVSLADTDLAGVQLNLLWSQTSGAMNGFQAGLVNRAGDMSGFQLGLVNLAGDMDGLQIGLWNRIDSKQSLKVIPIVNWKF